MQIIIPFICTISIEKLCMNLCKGQLLYALLETTTYVFTVTFDNNNYNFIQALLHYNCITLLQLMIHIDTIDTINYFCMHSGNFCMHQLLHYCTIVLLYYYTIVSHNFFMHYCNYFCIHCCNWEIQLQDDQKHWL